MKVWSILLLVLIVSGCATFYHDGLTAEEERLVSNLELYLSYIGKPVPDNFELDGVNSYVEIGGVGIGDYMYDRLSLDVENGLVSGCTLSRRYKESTPFFHWLTGYINVIEKQGFILFDKIYDQGSILHFYRKANLVIAIADNSGAIPDSPSGFIGVSVLY